MVFAVLASDVLRLLTTPANVPVFSYRASLAHQRSILRVDYVTDEHAARSLLPEPLALTAIPRASVYVTQYFDVLADSPIVEVAQAIEAVSPDGVVGDFVQAVYTDCIPAIIVNREAFLQPLLFGKGSVRHKDAVTDFSLTVNDTEVVRGSAGYKSEPMFFEDAMEFLRRPKFFLKVLGRPMLGEPSNPTLFALTSAEHKVTDAYRCPSRLSLGGHIMAPFDELPVRYIQSCHMFTASWTIGDAEILHRYR